MTTMQAVATFFEIFSVVGIGIISAMFTRFFSFLIGNPSDGEVDNNILSFYGRFILDRYNKAEVKKKYFALNWWKAAGMCPYCLNFYITSGTTVSSIYLLDVRWWWILPILAISHFFLSYIYDTQG